VVSQAYLIDTHCWLWWHIDPDKLGKVAFQIIGDGGSEIRFSVVSAWEITIKYQLKKLGLPLPPNRYIPTRLERSYMVVLLVHLEHILQLERLPLQHKDPFDRLLVAQACVEGLTVITSDPQFDRYDVETVF
jgi:PIN domain nuclease of toxin-antitoxin system